MYTSRSNAWKEDLQYTFPFPVNQFYKIILSTAQVDSDMISALDDCLSHYISFTNRRKLKQSLALVDAAGEVLAVLDADNMKVREATHASENEKIPVIVDLGGDVESTNVEIVGQHLDGEADAMGEALARKAMGLTSSTGSASGKSHDSRDANAGGKQKRSFWDSVMNFLALNDEIPPTPTKPVIEQQPSPVLRVTTLARNEAVCNCVLLMVLKTLF